MAASPLVFDCFTSSDTLYMTSLSKIVRGPVTMPFVGR